MPWGEVQRLTLILLSDPSSQVAASVRGWVHPVSRDDMVLRDLYDLQHRAKAKRRPDPYPRPWHVQPKKIGRGSLSIEEFQALRQSAADQN